MKPTPGKFPAYSYMVKWSLEDSEFVATFLELPGLSGLGPTVADAIEELNKAGRAWARVAERENFEIPDPLPSQGGERPLVIIESTAGEPIVADLAKVLPADIEADENSEIKTASEKDSASFEKIT